MKIEGDMPWTAARYRPPPFDPEPHQGYVLIVDDMEANRNLLATVLERANYRVDCIEDGRDILNQVREKAPDLVLMDVMMPEVDGFAACRTLKAHAATRLVPVVLLTGLHDTDSRVRGIHAGADDFLTKPFNLLELYARVRSLVRLKRYTDDLDSAEAAFVSLALAIEARDPYTNGHCQRLAKYSALLGQAVGLSDDDQMVLGRGAYLHDIGKVGIADAVLLKPARLTPLEYAHVQEHTVIGDHVCSELRSLRKVRSIVRHHHERLDGSGYPDGLRGDAIPLLAQITGIVDLHDAVTTSRPYRPALTIERAHDELHQEVAKGWRRQDLVDAWTKVSGGIGAISPKGDA